MWNACYSDTEYVYGTEPNDFLVSVANPIPGGRVLSLAEGEGRNAVYFASLGYKVLGVYASAVGMGKAQKLALERGVVIETPLLISRTSSSNPTVGMPLSPSSVIFHRISVSTFIAESSPDFAPAGSWHWKSIPRRNSN